MAQSARQLRNRDCREQRIGSRSEATWRTLGQRVLPSAGTSVQYFIVRSRVGSCPSWYTIWTALPRNAVYSEAAAVLTSRLSIWRSNSALPRTAKNSVKSCEPTRTILKFNARYDQSCALSRRTTSGQRSRAIADGFWGRRKRYSPSSNGT